MPGAPGNLQVSTHGSPVRGQIISVIPRFYYKMELFAIVVLYFAPDFVWTKQLQATMLRIFVCRPGCDSAQLRSSLVNTESSKRTEVCVGEQNRTYYGQI